MHQLRIRPFAALLFLAMALLLTRTQVALAMDRSPADTISCQTRASSPEIAQGKRSWQSSTANGGSASRANDGNVDGRWGGNSVSHTAPGKSSYWAVDLGATYAIDRVDIFNREDCCSERLDNFRILIRNSTSESWRKYNPGYSISVPAGSAGPAKTADYCFAGEREARYVMVQVVKADAILSLAEVKVYGKPLDSKQVTPLACSEKPTTPEIAQGKRASQSSTHGGGVASRANDGNLDGRWTGGSVTHTSPQANPWWTVDLGKVYEVDRIDLFNREDCCGARINDFKILTKEGAKDPWQGYGNALPRIAQSGPTKTADFCYRGERRARYVMVQLPGAERTLSLGELKVYGVPVDAPTAPTQPVTTSASLPRKSICTASQVPVKLATGAIRCESCPAGYTRRENSSGKGYCEKRRPANIVASKSAQKPDALGFCPRGTFKNAFSSEKACYFCPSDYKHDIGKKVNQAGVCTTTKTRFTTGVAEVIKPACLANQSFSPLNGGTCISCPADYSASIEKASGTISCRLALGVAIPTIKANVTADHTISTPIGDWTFRGATLTVDSEKKYIYGRATTSLFPVPTTATKNNAYFQALNQANAEFTPREARIEIGYGKDFGTGKKNAGTSATIGQIMLGKDAKFDLDPDGYYVFVEFDNTSLTSGNADLKLKIGSGSARILLRADPNAQDPVNALQNFQFFIGGDIIETLTLGLVPDAYAGIFLGQHRPTFTTKNKLWKSYEDHAPSEHTINPHFAIRRSGAISIPGVKLVSIDGVQDIYLVADQVIGAEKFEQMRGKFLIETEFASGVGIPGATIRLPSMRGSMWVEKNPKVVVKFHGSNGSTLRKQTSLPGDLKPISDILSPVFGEISTQKMSLDGYITENESVVSIGLGTPTLGGVQLANTTVTVKGKYSGGRVTEGGIYTDTNFSMLLTSVNLTGEVKTNGDYKFTGTQSLNKMLSYASIQGSLTATIERAVARGLRNPEMRITGAATALGSTFNLDGYYRNEADYSFTGTTSSAPAIASFASSSSKLSFAPGATSYTGKVSFLGANADLSGDFSPYGYDISGSAQLDAGAPGHLTASFSSTYDSREAWRGSQPVASAKVTGSLNFAGHNFSFNESIESRTTSLYSLHWKPVINIIDPLTKIKSGSLSADLYLKVTKGASAGKIRVEGYSAATISVLDQKKTVSGGFTSDGTVTYSVPLAGGLQAKVNVDYKTQTATVSF